MFDYTICNQANENIFHQQCCAIESHIPGVQKMELLRDVDDTLTQQYSHAKGMITVKNDMQVDALYVEADFDLLPYFAKS